MTAVGDVMCAGACEGGASREDMTLKMSGDDREDERWLTMEVSAAAGRGD